MSVARVVSQSTLRSSMDTLNTTTECCHDVWCRQSNVVILNVHSVVRPRSKQSVKSLQLIKLLRVDLYESAVSGRALTTVSLLTASDDYVHYLSESAVNYVALYSLST